MKGEPPLQAWIDVINTNLIGTINAIQVALPHLSEGASIIATGSTAALMDTPRTTTRQRSRRHGLRALEAAAVAICPRPRRPSSRRAASAPTSFTRRTATPTCCRASRCTESFRPDLEHPTRADAEPVFCVQQAMKVPCIEPEDISNTVLCLASDEARYVTGHAAARGRRRLPQVVRLPHLIGGDTVKVFVDSRTLPGPHPVLDDRPGFLRAQRH